MPKKKEKRGPRYEVWWENPPGPRSGLTISRYQGDTCYEREVGLDDLLNPTEIAAILEYTRMHVWRLMKSGELKTVRRGGNRFVSLKSVKKFLRERDF